jgi:hypothetical protein
MQEVSVDLPTAIGVGLLGGATALWRLQGRWKKSKKAFWEDWKRAQEGLSYDLQVCASLRSRGIGTDDRVCCRLMQTTYSSRKSSSKLIQQDIFSGSS